MLIIGILAGLALCLALCAAGDRDNFSGDLNITAPTGGYTRGKIYALQNSHVVARETKSAGAAVLVAFRGAIEVTKVTGTGKSFAVGQKVYYVSASNSVTPSATGNTLLAATVLRAATTTDTSVLIQLDGPSPTLT